MKLTFVIDSLALGGAQKHLRQMAVGLTARGHRAHVISLNGVCHPALGAPLAAAGIPVTVIGRSAMLRGPGFFRLCRLLRSDRPDLLITVLFASTIAGRIAARLVGISRVVTCVQARNINYRWWQFALLRLTSGFTVRYFFNSRSAMPFAGKCEGARPERSHYVANGVESRAENGALLRTAWADFGLPFQPDDEVIGTIGRLDPQKGYTGLLQAFARVVRERERARLLVIGAGPQELELRELARELGLAERMIFAGERADGAELIALARVYVQPSIFEGTPNALMEAMAAGTASVSSAVDGIPEVISHGVSGWLVPPGEPEMLAKAILTALREPEQTKAVGRRGQEWVLEKFGLDRMIDEYERYFVELFDAPVKCAARKKRDP